MKPQIRKIGLVASAIILLLTPSMKGQILSNGSFETSGLVHYQQINGNWNQSTFASGWHTPTGGSPDLFNDGALNSAACGNVYSTTLNGDNPGIALNNFTPYCCYPQVCTSTNIFGSENPRSHSSDPNWPVFNHQFAGLALHGEYLQSPQFTQLAAGACYTLTFWLSRADMSPEGVRMQVLFSHDLLTQLSNQGTMTYAADPTAYVLTPRHPVMNRQGWTRVTINFKATGNERYITFGVFDPNGVFNPVTGQTDPVIIPADYPDLTPFDCDNTNGPNGCGPVPPSSISYIRQNQTFLLNCAGNNTVHCQAFNTDYFYIDDVSLAIQTSSNLTINHSFVSTTLTSANSYSNSNILLTGNITISGNVTWTDCQIRCNNNATIIVTPGSYLHIIGTSATSSNMSAGCDLMWNGIVVNGSGRIEINQTKIQDAITAITLNAGSGWQISNNSEFSKNAADIVASGITPYTNFIKSTTFDLATPLADATQGVNGFATTAITFNAQLTGAAQTVGGTGAGEGCMFIGSGNSQWQGQGSFYAINSLSRDINVYNCTFNNFLNCAINFIGASIQKRSLNILDCNFNNNLQDIFSEAKTNLTVKSSDFYNSIIAVRWYDNPNCDLTIGSTLIPSEGNTFKSCRYGIQCWNNKCTGGSNLNGSIFASTNGVAPFTDNLFTDIIIANNQMYGIVNTYSIVGIGIHEYVLGSDIAYHTLQIYGNFVSLFQSGIEFDNVRGYGGYVINTSTLNQTHPFYLLNNAVLTSTQFSPQARGITMKNSPGANVEANPVVSDAPGNWQNYGIYLENCRYTELVGNPIKAGTGIVLASDELYSNVWCNSLAGNTCGINLAGASLRPQNMLHAFPLGNGNYRSYNNYFTGPSLPWAVDIQNYFSQNDYNKWAWDNTATNTYPKTWISSSASFETNHTATSIISPTIGIDECIYFPVYPSRIADVAFAFGENVAMSYADPVAQWVSDYNYQIQKNNTGQGNNAQASQNIKRIIRIEDAITELNFNVANAQMNGFNPSNTVEQNYKSYLTVLLAVNDPIRIATQAEKDILIAIAQQTPRVGGPSVYLARAYLFYSDQMRFDDEDFSGPKVSGTAFIQSPCCLTPASGTTLTFADQFGNELPIPGAQVYQDGSFTFDPFQLQYYSSQSPGTLYRITEKAPSKFTSLNKDFKTLSDWIAASPVTVLLGGVMLDTTKVTVQPDTVIAQVTTATDVSGNTYSIGVSGSTNTDFLVEKRDQSNQLLWSKTFDGPSSGNDTATSMTLDNLGNVYVVGKVWNNNHYDFQAVKYDSTGFMEWSSLLDDTLGRNNEPTGVCLNPSDQTVCIVGRCCSQSQAHYRIAKYKQCITTNSSRMMQAEAQPAPVSMIEYYPNPSEGTLNIELKNASGGQLELFNLNGQLAFSQQITQSGMLSFPQEIVPNGVYLLKFTSTSAVPQFGKVVIHRN